ncbi:MAG: ParA family protein [Minisyncoccia bacterium]
MAEIIAICNQKGGVGKTTTAVNLSSYLAYFGRKTLVVDFDPQANATSGLGINYKNLNKTIYHLLIKKGLIKEILLNSQVFGLDILPASPDLIGAQVELSSFENKERRLEEILALLVPYYQYIIIDLPPSLGLLTINGLVASEYVLIPIQTEFYALEGLAQLVSTIDLIRRNLDKDLKILGAVLTMYDKRNKLDRLVVKHIIRHFPGYVFNSIIPRNIDLAQAPAFGKPILLYNSNSNGAKAYKNFTQELISLLEKRSF